MMTHRYMNPLSMGTYVMSLLYAWLGRSMATPSNR